jgi:hypothetical protein
MPETTAAPVTQADPKQTANNIVKGIHERSYGKAPAGKAPAAAEPPINNSQPPVDPSASDPNAGKEKYVVEGKEVWLTPDQARSYVQKGIAFEPRMDQLARLAQEQNQLINALIEDPGTVLANIAKQRNVPLETIVQKVLKGNASDEIKEAVGQWYYREAVEPLHLTPEQLKAREDAKWRQEREEKDKSEQTKTIQQENQAKFQRAMGELKANIAEAMKESGLPSNDSALGAEMARAVAEVMRVAYVKRQTITPKAAIEFVKKRMIEVQTAYYDHLDGPALVSMLGEKNAEKVKNHFLKVVQDSMNRPPVVPSGKKPPARNGERPTRNMDDFHEMLKKFKE